MPRGVIDQDIPVDALEQINALIDESNEAVDAANGSFDAELEPADDDAGPSDQVSDEAAEAQRVAADKGQSAESEVDDESADQDTAALSADADDLEGATFEDDGGDEPDEVVTLRSELEELKAWRENMLQSAREAEERQIEAQQQQRAEEQYQQFMASLEDMDPVDAEKAKTALVMNYAVSLLQQNQAQTLTQQEHEQRTAAIAFIKNGGRVVRNAQGGYDRVPNAAKPLTEDEAELLTLLDHPQKMETFADKAIARRQAQTAKARQAIAQRRKDAGEGQVTGGGGRTASPPTRPEPTTEEEYFAELDEVYGGSPEALRNQSSGLRRTG